MTEVVIAGIGQTEVGEHWDIGLRELAFAAIQAKGNYADFLGAVFFHSLLSSIIAAILGTIGGVVGRRIARIRAERLPNF